MIIRFETNGFRLMRFMWESIRILFLLFPVLFVCLFIFISIRFACIESHHINHYTDHHHHQYFTLIALDSICIWLEWAFLSIDALNFHEMPNSKKLCRARFQKGMWAVFLFVNIWIKSNQIKCVQNIEILWTNNAYWRNIIKFQVQKKGKTLYIHICEHVCVSDS